MNLTEIITGKPRVARPYVKLHEPNPTTRPCLYWPAFLMRLSARGLIGTPRYQLSWSKERTRLQALYNQAQALYTNIAR
jgi:hypothetical protein